MDFSENKDASNNLIINREEKIQDQLPRIYEETQKFSKEFDSIICVAGGFAVSSVKDNDVIEKYLEMDKMNFQSALLTSHLSTKFLGP